MAKATIKIEIHYVETIKEAFTEAIRLSNMLQCYVSFEFNEINCTAEPNMTIYNAIDDYLKLVHERNVQLLKKSKFNY